MALNSLEQRLQRVTKSPAQQLDLMQEGVSIASGLSRTLDDAMAQTVADRLDLADEFLVMAERLMRSRHDLFRPAIARYYYAMYHAMRAASFQFVGGDDHQEHSELSSKGVPVDYPSKALKSNELKVARILRNEADYEPYPRLPGYFRFEATALRPTAQAFVTGARAYVTSKGNPYS